MTTLSVKIHFRYSNCHPNQLPPKPPQLSCRTMLAIECYTVANQNVIPHFQKFNRLHCQFMFTNNASSCQQNLLLCVRFLGQMSTVEVQCNLQIMKHMQVCKNIIFLPCFSYPHKLYCGRPWPAAYINFNQNIHQIQVLTKPLCRAQAMFY